MSAWNRAFGAVAAGLLLLGVPLASSADGWHGGHGGWHGGHDHHDGGTHVVIGVSPYWFGGFGGPWPYYGYGYGYYGPPAPYYYYPAPYYYPQPYAVYAPPQALVEQPVYVERDAAPAPAASSYWYYCESSGGYYPDVATCPEPWVRVPPRAE